MLIAFLIGCFLALAFATGYAVGVPVGRRMMSQAFTRQVAKLVAEMRGTASERDGDVRGR